MAIGWLTVLQNVPWSSVISNAPAVADGAKKLWNAVSKKGAPEAKTVDPVVVNPGDMGSAVTLLAQKVAALETSHAELRGQLIATSELLKSLAEQNQSLVQRIEVNRRRVLGLAILMVLSVIGTITAFIVGQ